MRPGLPDGNILRYAGFFQYYQISGRHENDESGFEPKSEEELEATGLHSLWGFAWAIIEKTGWSLKYVLWGISWINIQLMLADGPGVKKKNTNKKEIESDEELIEFLGL